MVSVGTSTSRPSPLRPLRADARRNRDAILAAARDLFETDGIYAPLDCIATMAGVGNATLYRNFPTRNDLLAAVIEDGIGELLAESESLDHDLSAEDALREWLYRVAWQLRIWHELPTCIASSIDDAESPVQDVATRLTNRTRDLLHRAQPDAATDCVTAEELFELITAVSWGVDRFNDDPDRARRRVALATAGILGPPRGRPS
jgi:AcrR family transcriptional regulator